MIAPAASLCLCTPPALSAAGASLPSGAEGRSREKRGRSGISRWVTLLLCVWAGLAAGQDVTPPSLISASSATGQQIGICFSEEITPGSLAEPSNYLVEDGEGIKGLK